MPLLRWVLLILGAGAFLVTGIQRHLDRAEQVLPGPELLRAVSPNAPALSRLDGPHGPYFTDTDTGAANALAFVTDQVSPQIVGYAGEISLLVGVDGNGTVTGVRLMNHEETPSYMQSIIGSGFLERLAGRKLGAELAGVDAVTGATITSNAIREDVLRGGALLARDRFGLEIEGVPAPKGFLGSLADSHSIAILGAMAIALAAFSLKSFRAGRPLSLAAGLIALGLYNNLPLSTAHFTNLAATKIPSASNAPLILVLGFVFFTGIIFRSRVYCDYLCPFAAVQEAVYAVSHRRTKVSDRVWRTGALARHLLLFVIAILVSVGGYHSVGAMEPYVFLFNPQARVLPWVYVGVVIVAAIFVKRFWCRIFCPCGACVELVASARGRRGRIVSSGGAK